MSHIFYRSNTEPQAIGNVEYISSWNAISSVYLPYYQGCVIINPEMIKETDRRKQTTLPTDIPHAALVMQVTTMRVCARCKHARNI
ncbi:hypothetical protein KCP74_21255 [Salmonella enterica subsp. enterica]|nr:hypothetical protein KCP74_21255 [Salmonella enterica subsp. enterica]